MVVILDEVLTSSDCNRLINIYESNKHSVRPWGDPQFYPLNFDFITSDSEFMNSIINKLESAVKIYNKDAIIDWTEITKWVPDTYMRAHVDDASDRTILTSITYLTDDFDGGETYFEDGIKVKPKVGRVLFFRGQDKVHGVNKILNRDRYTISTFYKRKE